MALRLCEFWPWASWSDPLFSPWSLSADTGERLFSDSRGGWTIANPDRISPWLKSCKACQQWFRGLAQSFMEKLPCWRNFCSCVLVEVWCDVCGLTEKQALFVSVNHVVSVWDLFGSDMLCKMRLANCALWDTTLHALKVSVCTGSLALKLRAKLRDIVGNPTRWINSLMRQASGSNGL